MRVLLRSPRSPFETRSPYVMLEQNLIGGNTGNLVFLDAIHRILGRPDVDLAVDRFRLDPATADRISEQADLYVIPFANAFRPGFDERMERWTELIERLRIPVVVLGIGVQSSIDYDFAPLRGREALAKRFARAVLARSPSIGVRGEFTASWLNHLGFKDVEVIGCPSMFWDGERFPEVRPVAPLGPGTKLALTVTAGRGELTAFVARHTRRYPLLTHVGQDDATLRRVLFGPASPIGPPAKIPTDVLEPLFAEGRTRVFLHPVPWRQFLETIDFTVGTRIHGSIVSLLAGTPTVVLAHDSRTLELSRYFEIPHRVLADLPPDADAADLARDVDDRTAAGHPGRWRAFEAYLHRQGLRHAFEAGGDRGAAFDARVARMRHEVLVSGRPRYPGVRGTVLRAGLEVRPAIRRWRQRLARGGRSGR